MLPAGGRATSVRVAGRARSTDQVRPPACSLVSVTVPTRRDHPLVAMLSSDASSGSSLFSWLAQFGVVPESTGLDLWTGGGPHERGLRTRAHRHTRNRGRKDVEDETTSENTTATSTPCPCCPNGSSCTCFDGAPIESPVLSIPSGLLITPARVRASGVVSEMMRREDAERANDSELLSLFLVHQHRLGSLSKWSPYVSSLPRSYTSVEWWSSSELASCQHAAIVDEAAERRAAVVREWRRVNQWMAKRRPNMVDPDELSHSTESNAAAAEPPLPLHWTQSVPPHSCDAAGPCTSTTLCSMPTLSEFQWAWSSVSTRSCFLPPLHSSAAEVGAAKSSTGGGPADRDRSCLIPFLDMLNHSSSVHMDCRLTPSSYQLWMVRPSPLRLHPGEELFISYGAHANSVLLARYGFAMMHNRHEAIKMRLDDVEAFIASAQPLLSDAQHAAIVSPWPRPPAADASLRTDEDFFTCGCAQRHDLSRAVSSVPRYSRPLPGFGRRVPSWQLDLLRGCGLYDIADQLVATSPTGITKPLTFTLQCCSLPSDLATYLRVRVLTLDEAQQACRAQSAESTSQKSSRSSSKLVSHATAAPPPASGLTSAEVASLASRLLDEDTPHLSRSHQLLTRRVLVELLLARLTDASALGATSLQDDLHDWCARDQPTGVHDAPLTYAQQQALVLRLTQKRLCHTLLAHALLAREDESTSHGH